MTVATGIGTPEKHGLPFVSTFQPQYELMGEGKIEAKNLPTPKIKRRGTEYLIVLEVVVVVGVRRWW